MVTIKNNKGYGILFVVFVLAFMAGVIYFLALNRSVARLNTKNLTLSSQVDELLEAGFADAINDIRDNASSVSGSVTFSGIADTVLNDPPVAGDTVSYRISVIDEQGKININNPEHQEVIKNLLVSNGLSNISGLIITEQPYGSIEELLVPDVNLPLPDFNIIKDYITVHSFTDTQGTGEYTFDHNGFAPVNINTASREVLEAVFDTLTANPDTLADAVIPGQPYNNWSDIYNVLPANVAATVNPNVGTGNKPLTPTTELCLFSGGRYTLVGSASIMQDGNVVAHKEKNRIVKVHDVFFQTMANDFKKNRNDGPTLMDSSGIISTDDTCPVRATDNGNSYIIDTQVDDSIKMGCWKSSMIDQNPGFIEYLVISAKEISDFSVRVKCTTSNTTDIVQIAFAYPFLMMGDIDDGLKVYFSRPDILTNTGSAFLEEPGMDPGSGNIVKKVEQDANWDHPLTYRLEVERDGANPNINIKFTLAEAGNYNTAQMLEENAYNCNALDGGSDGEVTTGQVALVLPGTNSAQATFENVRFVPAQTTYRGSADLGTEIIIGAFQINQDFIANGFDTYIDINDVAVQSAGVNNNSVKYDVFMEALPTDLNQSAVLTDLTTLYFTPVEILDDKEIFSQ